MDINLKEKYNKNLYYQHGYIALTSAIIISFLLLTITVNLAMSGFFTRTNILDSESKERGIALAKSCGDKAIFNLVQGITYTGSVNIENEQCNISSVLKDTPTLGQTTIKTQANVNGSYSNLKIIADSNIFKIISWEECSSLNYC